MPHFSNLPLLIFWLFFFLLFFYYLLLGFNFLFGNSFTLIVCFSRLWIF